MEIQHNTKLMQFRPLCCKSEAILCKKFRPGHQGWSVQINTFHPGYRDLGSHGNRASPASHINTCTNYTIKSKAKTNRYTHAHVFPRFASAMCVHFQIWLVHWNVRVSCDRLEWYSYIVHVKALSKLAAIQPCLNHLTEEAGHLKASTECSRKLRSLTNHACEGTIQPYIHYNQSHFISILFYIL